MTRRRSAEHFPQEGRYLNVRQHVQQLSPGWCCQTLSHTLLALVQVLVYDQLQFYSELHIPQILICMQLPLNSVHSFLFTFWRKSSSAGDADVWPLPRRGGHGHDHIHFNQYIKH